MKNLFIIIFLFAFFAYPASAQYHLTLDTAPLGEAKTVILPTYANLLKLRMADSIQFTETMKYYGYEQINGTRLSYCTKDDDDYFVSKDDKYSATIFFSVNTLYFQALEEDIRKRFANAKHNTIKNREDYTITVNDKTGRHFQTIDIDKTGPGLNSPGGSGSITIVK